MAKNDQRFKGTANNPKFHKPKKTQQKVVLDDRFKDLFEFDKSNKYGRKLKSKDDAEQLKQFYKLDDTDKMDFARGEAVMEDSSDSSDDSGDDPADSSDDDDEVELQPENYENKLIGSDEEESDEEEEDSPEALDDDEIKDEMRRLDAQAEAYNDGHVEEETIDFTTRLAVTSLDWDHLSATDIYVALDSVMQTTDLKKSLKNVKVYMSQFGRKRLEQEEQSGPALVSTKKSKKGKEREVDPDSALREYQLGRLKYYYAIVTMSSSKAAHKLFTEAQNTEIERTANVIQFEVVPDGVEFDEVDIRDQASTSSEAYKGVDFTTPALRHSKVKLTWDEDDDKRVALTRKRFNQADIEQNDFKAYIASDSDSDDDDETQKKRAALLRAALGGGGADDARELRGGKKDREGEMEVTFAPGLSEKVDKNDDESDEENMTTLEKYKKKEKQKKNARKEKKKAKDNAGEEEEEHVPVQDDAGFDDEFFQSGSEDEAAFENRRDDEGITKPSKGGKKDKKAIKEPKDDKSRVESTAEELQLLTNEDDEKHFDMDEIIKKEKQSNRKRKHRKTKEENTKDDFEIDIQDDRFKGVLDDHQFAIDPTLPNFKATKNMKKLLAERSSRSQANSGQDFNADNDRSINSLISSVKQKSNKKLHLYTLSISLPLPDLPNKSFIFPSDDFRKSADLATIAAALTQTHSCLVKYTVTDTRGSLIRDLPLNYTETLKIPKSDILVHDLNSASGGQGGAQSSASTQLSCLNPLIRDKLVELNSTMNVNFSLLELPPSNFQNGLQLQSLVQLSILGGQESVEHAKIQILVTIDQHLGLHADKVDIDFKLHPIIASKKRSVIRTIEEETETNIYLPPPLAGVLGNSSPRAGSLPDHRNLIYITGDFFGVQRAKDMLVQVAVQKVNSKSVLSRDAALLPRKLDSLVVEKADEIRTIMADNGTFIKFPIIGSQASIIQIFGDNRVSIERTIRSIMQLACYYYVASVWLLPVTFDVLIPPPSINPSTVPASDLERLALESGAEIVLKSNCFEAHGSDTAVRDAIARVLELDIVQGFHHEIRFQVELANEHRDFISGKKNGKINKIMKSANVRIKYETLSEYNFLIDVAGSDLGALSGLSMLQEELPAEMSFHVPEVYHKRIIGVGGKNIQRIMKKFGVYVKFSNADEFAALGGYCDNEDNVISRTPAKNAMNLENLKQSVMELVNPKDKDYTNESILIPRKYHRTLLGEKSIFLHDIESKTGCSVRFPDKELATDSVAIFGPEHQVNVAKTMVLDHVPFEAEYLTPRSNEIRNAVNDTKFIELVNSLRSDLHVSISAPAQLLKSTENGQNTPPQSSNSDTASDDEEDLAFKVRCQRSNIDMLGAAKETLEDYLKSRNVPVHTRPSAPVQQPMRADALAGAFPLFNSKIIPAAESPTKESFDGFQDASAQFTRPGESRYHPLSNNSIGGGSSAAALMGQKPNFTGSSTLGGIKTGAVGSGRRLRAAVSTPNVKALFGNDSSGGYPGSAMSSPDSNTALSSPYGGIGEDTSSPATAAQLQQAQAAAAYYAAASQHAQEQHYTQNVWGPPTPPTQYVRPIPTAADATKSYAQTTEEAVKRGSDSVLESKLKTQPQRTLASQRAQSLDLGALVGKTPNSTTVQGQNANAGGYAGVVGDPSSGSGSYSPSGTQSSNRPSPREFNKPQRASHLTHQPHYSLGGGPISGVMQQDQSIFGSSASLGGHAHTRSLPQVTPPELDQNPQSQFYSPISPPGNPIGSSASIYAHPTQPTGLRHARSLSTNPRNTLQNIPNPISIPPTDNSANQSNFSNPNSATSATFSSSQQIPSRIATPSNFDGLSSDQANEISRVLAQVRLDQN
ncbi:hypothetical protein E3Q19_01585 [Wallemia mellicola]|nr:hypothetical protein E3Q19_01585 [Wallemia mellicola]